MKKIFTIIILLMFDVGASYIDTVKSIQPTNLIQYYPMQETSGTVAYDSSGNGRNGQYYQVTLSQSGLDSVNKSVKCNGSTSAILYTTSGNGFSTALNRDEGSQMIWFYSNASPNWGGAGTDGTKVIYKMYYSNSNLIQLGATNTNLIIHHIHKGTTKQYTIALNLLAQTNVSNRFICFIMTWSKSNNRIRIFLNGSQVTNEQIYDGWDNGTLSTTKSAIGESDAAYYFNGYISHFATWNTELSRREVDSLSLIKTPSVLGFGDGITYGYDATNSTKSFLYRLCVDVIKTPFFNNVGVNGTVLQNTPASIFLNAPQTGNGRDRVRSDLLSYCPKLAVLAYGLYDMNCSDTAINISHFTNDYCEVIDSCKANGISDIMLQTLTLYGSYGMNPPYNGGTLAKHRQYNDSIIAIANRKRCRLSNVYNFMSAMGGNSALMNNGIFPNDSGHHVISIADSTALYTLYSKLIIGKFIEP